MADVTIYTTLSCPYCTMAKRLLGARNVPYAEVDVTNDPGKRAWLLQTTRRRTVPQIFIGQESIGGFDELSALDRSGKLAPMLAAAAGRHAPTGA